MRLNIIFDKVTRHSLVLLNESLTSTSPGESVYLAKDLIKAFKLTGSIVIYTTHLHELAMQIDEINRLTGGDSRLISLVSVVNEKDHSTNSFFERSYRIIPGKPAGKSYAEEIALKHGIDFEQLKTKLSGRGIIHDE